MALQMAPDKTTTESYEWSDRELRSPMYYGEEERP